MNCKRNLIIALLSIITMSGTAQTDNLKEGFVNPPQSARPRVWWHWMNGNISADGIRKDLEWMNRAGLGGVHIFDAGKNTPQVVPQRIVYMTPEWKKCYELAVSLADSLNMEATMTVTPGWSNTGGPWVKPCDAMKKLVWRETTVKGGQSVNIILPEPYTVNGTFQNVKARGTVSDKTYYKDIAVIAIKMGSELSLRDMGAKVTASSGNFSIDMLTDGDIAKSEKLTADSTGKTAWIKIELNKPYTVKTLSLADGRQHSQWRNKRPAPTKWLEASNDGINFSKVCNLVLGGAPLTTVDIPSTTARYFRVVWQMDKHPLAISELNLYTSFRVNHAEEKAAFGTPVDLPLYPTAETNEATRLTDIINITQYTDSTGHLTWKAPKGNWRILRFGYSLTGKMNHPASPEATGLEVDKMSAEAVQRYISTYLSSYDFAIKGKDGKSRLTHLLIDSYEAGISNWTPLMAQEFKTRRGYDMMPWMPTLTGIIIESAEKTDRFLYDWRKTIGELIEQNLYRQIADTMKARNMGTYIESHESCRVYEADGMAVKQHSTIPMGAMWASEYVMHMNDRGETGKQGDIRESASVAHIYGQNLVAAESLTSNGKDGDGLAYSLTPNLLKPVADLEFASGVNRIVIHDSAHQPVDNKIPGQGLEVYGQWFHRHETWAEQTRPWIDYLSRTSYMLQQGLYVADVAYYYGDDNNVTGLFYAEQPDVPPTASYDYVNTTALTEAMDYKDGQLVTPSGMTYRMLALDKNTERITVPALRHIAKMVDQGLPLCGKRPKQVLSLTDNIDEFKQLVAYIWDKQRPNVFENMSIDQALKAAGIGPDMECNTMDSLRFVHRHTKEAEIYWVNNRCYQTRTLNAHFRVKGMTPYVWHPETGNINKVDYTVKDGYTYINLHMNPAEAYFIVFRATTDTTAKPSITHASNTTTIAVTNPWTVTFQSNRGAPAKVEMTALQSLSENSNEGIRYFAGTATYHTAVKLTKAQAKGKRIQINLGKVNALAEVIVNGQNKGILWCSPFCIDITDAAKSGNNTLEIRVTTLWRNRIIGDEQPECTQRYTYTSYKFYDKNSKLQPSGLMGPVTLSISTDKQQ